MNLIQLIVLIIGLYLLKNVILQRIRCGCGEYAKLERFQVNDTMPLAPGPQNLAGLSRQDIQDLKNYDLSKIDWTKIDDYTYAQIVCIVQGCDTRPIIKNLPISSSPN